MLLIWRRWRGWRRGRPFWGGLFTVIAGVEIGVLPLAPMKVMLHQGTAGIPSVVLAAVIVVLGLSGIFTPQYRGLAGIITVMLSAAALVLSNLGGFMIGTLLGVVGGALMFAWRPQPAAPPEEPVAEGDTGSGDTGSEGSTRSGGGTGVAVGATAAQPAVFSSEAPEPSRTSVPDSGGAGDASTATAAGAAAGTAPGKSASADSSLAAAFGVDDDPFPPSHGDTPRT